jgi:hypothetical protein
MEHIRIAVGMKFDQEVILRSAIEHGLQARGRWDVVCRDKRTGKIKWTDTIHNLVTNEGLNHLLDVTLSGAAQDTTWFVGLTDSAPTAAAGDTLASHAGWTEITDYDEVNRVAWVDGGVSGQSLSNTASPADFTIDASVTVGGAFLAGVNTGTSGVLYAVGAFTAGDKGLSDNDVLTVTATFTAAAA